MTHRNGLLLLALSFGAAMAHAGGASPRTKVVAPPGCSTTTRFCFVDVEVAGSTVTFKPEELHVKESDRGHRYHIIFRLQNGYTFKPAQGDGVFLKVGVDDQEEFYDKYVVDDDSGKPPTLKKDWRRYHWRYVNCKDGAYDYKVQFRDPYGAPVVGDPRITNVDTH